MNYYHQTHGPPEDYSWEAIQRKLIEAEESEHEIEEEPQFII